MVRRDRIENCWVLKIPTTAPKGYQFGTSLFSVPEGIAPDEAVTLARAWFNPVALPRFLGGRVMDVQGQPLIERTPLRERFVASLEERYGKPYYKDLKVFIDND